LRPAGSSPWRRGARSRSTPGWRGSSRGCQYWVSSPPLRHRRAGSCRQAGERPSAVAASPDARPSPRESGEHRAVRCRWACSKRFCQATTFACNSRRAAPGPREDLQQGARHGQGQHPRSPRHRAARAWISVIWRCWLDISAVSSHSLGALTCAADVMHPGAAARSNSWETRVDAEAADVHSSGGDRLCVPGGCLFPPVQQGWAGSEHLDDARVRGFKSVRMRRSATAQHPATAIAGTNPP
jgi:hypothetical protein